MTTPDFDAMSGVVIAAVAAGLCGWTKRMSGDACDSLVAAWFDESGAYRYNVDADSFESGSHLFPFDPASDLNHAAELGAAFLAAFPAWNIFVESPGSRGVWNACVWRENSGGNYTGHHPSESHARTVATLKAWMALNGTS